ncbi:hypothetical protein C8Q80DRAFT_1343908 [Daedaleopsis nitida]|nr:hypothetical protein C8Q80DRAFT_1343908 [Daedaleopsis nitida]
MEGDGANDVGALKQAHTGVEDTEYGGGPEEDYGAPENMDEPSIGTPLVAEDLLNLQIRLGFSIVQQNRAASDFTRARVFVQHHVYISLVVCGSGAGVNGRPK